MRRVFALASALVLIAGLGVYVAASASETFGWSGFKTDLLGLGAGAFVVLYVIGGTADLFLRSPSGSGPRRKRAPRDASEQRNTT